MAFFLLYVQLEMRRYADFTFAVDQLALMSLFLNQKLVYSGKGFHLAVEVALLLLRKI
jgi:hypothetical protein